MEIIERSSTIRPVRFQCEICGCVFVASCYEYSIKKHFLSGDEYEVSCPECGRKVTKPKYGYFVPMIG